MAEHYLYAILSVLLVSSLSLLVAVPILLKRKISQKVLVFLLSMSVGVLLATVFFNLVPEAFSADAHGHEEEHNLFFPGVYILLGFFVMFIIEKFIHFHHNKDCYGQDCGHSHAYSVAPINLIGDGVHNFIDGTIIAGSYLVSFPVGLATTISVIFHELPQELADLGVLLYSGMRRKKAVFFNFLSALTAVLGTVFGLFLGGMIDSFAIFMISFAAGNFLYIAATNLLPELHRHCKLKDTLLHLTAIALGVGLIFLVQLLFAHSH